MDETAKLLARKAKLEEKIRESRLRERQKARRIHDKAVRIIGEALMQRAGRSDADRQAVLDLLDPLVTDGKDRAFVGLPVRDEPAYEPVSSDRPDDAEPV